MTELQLFLSIYTYVHNDSSQLPKEKTRPRFEPFKSVPTAGTGASALIRNYALYVIVTIIFVYLNVAFEAISRTDLVPKSYFTDFTSVLRFITALRKSPYPPPIL